MQLEVAPLRCYGLISCSCTSVAQQRLRDAWSQPRESVEFESGHDAPIENCSIMRTCQAIRRLGTKLRWQLQPLALADVAGLAVVVLPEEQEVDNDNQAAAKSRPASDLNSPYAGLSSR